mmetsp:Transcript_1486/g.2372  ORF Transcript_1486/g.2372 Transcript_1486/m.2372 type:complete len:207 (-) Transcript_1486:664-1284(-)
MHTLVAPCSHGVRKRHIAIRLILSCCAAPRYWVTETRSNCRRSVIRTSTRSGRRCTLHAVHHHVVRMPLSMAVHHDAVVSGALRRESRASPDRLLLCRLLLVLFVFFLITVLFLDYNHRRPWSYKFVFHRERIRFFGLLTLLVVVKLDHIVEHQLFSREFLQCEIRPNSLRIVAVLNVALFNFCLLHWHPDAHCFVDAHRFHLFCC